MSDLDLSAKAPARTTKRDDLQLLGQMGLFGVHMAVIGLGVEVLEDEKRIGRNLMKLGALLGVAGYGVRWLA